MNAKSVGQGFCLVLVRPFLVGRFANESLNMLLAERVVDFAKSRGTVLTAVVEHTAQVVRGVSVDTPELFFPTEKYIFLQQWKLPLLWTGRPKLRTTKEMYSRW